MMNREVCLAEIIYYLVNLRECRAKNLKRFKERRQKMLEKRLVMKRNRSFDKGFSFKVLFTITIEKLR